MAKELILSLEHQNVIDNYGVSVSDLPVGLRSKFKAIESQISKFKEDPSNEELFSSIQAKIEKFSNELCQYLEQNPDEE